ncbi:DNA polymerase III subunit epsilon [Testudinibacter aquarius]|uniref:DNA polymerase III subunit epsilon n=1 Tax=Testudinibacter aquarius TaxID=1524974 RepID=A0A4R3XYL8_9PAST|nr:DNA polymerase III subunit epsilon [Testudinibacter aquarius]KAE9528430.1 DNA polymerase III subunit epsilon [Testudinibacter aquarius]TCV84192.1 DNA polymerase III epsilon subunit [Testudinibacter aquarius]TNG92580.1 DNA polymerase III subunit epsilon [Testudinibacter aquarius]
MTTKSTPQIIPQRQVVLDTETTGMNQFGAHYEGHCIIEIGAVELINRRLTGRTFHVYIKPDREVDPEAIKVHGITDEMLADKPPFADIAAEFIEFIRDAELIIHNAPFDVGFMDYEFSKLAATKQIKTHKISLITDSLAMARKMYPGKRNNLDALCDRLNIDNSKRSLHGALLDAEILADVYLQMTGGQVSLFDEEHTIENMSHTASNHNVSTNSSLTASKNASLRTILPDDEEQQAHRNYFELLQKKSRNNCIWLKRSEH